MWMGLSLVLHSVALSQVLHLVVCGNVYTAVEQ